MAASALSPTGFTSSGARLSLILQPAENGTEGKVSRDVDRLAVGQIGGEP